MSVHRWKSLSVSSFICTLTYALGTGHMSGAEGQVDMVYAMVEVLAEGVLPIQ